MHGENLLMPVGKKESTAPSSEMNHTISHQTLSNRLTPLLIARGLVKGIIPMSMRERSGQQTLDVVLRPQDGNCADEQKVG